MITALYNRLTSPLNSLDNSLPVIARLAFASTLLGYYLSSAKTKLGDGLLGFLIPSDGAYAQIFPRAFEAAGYDRGDLTAFHWLVTVAGTWAEFLLPVLIVIGLFTRLAALGMIGFITVQSLTDIFGHGLINDPQTIGMLFDRFADGLILDQRLLWCVPLIILIAKGGGILSADKTLALR